MRDLYEAVGIQGSCLVDPQRLLTAWYPCLVLELPGPPKEPKIMAQYPKIESTGSIGSITLAILEVQVVLI